MEKPLYPDRSRVTESREQYLERALKYCNERLAWHSRVRPHCHKSHNVSKAMKDTEHIFVDLGTFGVEGDSALNCEGCIDIQWLNTGETYELTIVYFQGQLQIASWGDIAEQYSSQKG